MVSGFLGLGNEQMNPQINKTAAVVACLGPMDKKMRQFLRLAVNYRSCVVNYLELTSQLIEATKPDPFEWSEQCQWAFVRDKATFCGGPLL